LRAVDDDLSIEVRISMICIETRAPSSRFDRIFFGKRVSGKCTNLWDEEATMRRLRPAQLGWTTEDQATFSKWFKAVCVFYGALALLLFAGLGAYVADSGQTRATAAITSTPTAR
jgi:hypothetical protein